MNQYLCRITWHGTKASVELLGTPVVSFTNKVNPRLAKRPLKTNGRLANLELSSLVKEAAGVHPTASG